MIEPRTIRVQALASTWPRSRQMPASFPMHITTERIDVAAVLNLIGVLTTPPLSGGASLSEMWAYIRYFFAITEDDDLRLTSEFGEMDPHQKTILSDDFGMGFGMHWLAEHLSFVAACDSRYFIENHLTHVGGTYTGGSAKRGLGKSPDFVAMDRHGRFHVIECKGTQSSLTYRNRQLMDTARAQKHTISLPAHLAGERLATGIFIGGPTGDNSELRIIDPEPPEAYVIKDEEPDLVRSAIARGTIAKQLRSAGFPRLSSAVAYPRRRPNIEAMNEFIEEPQEVARRGEQATREVEELGRRSFRTKEREYVGRRVRMVLPRPIWTKRGKYERIEVRQGLERSTFQEVLHWKEGYLLEKSSVNGMTGTYRFGESKGRAWITFGDAYYSDIRLLR